MDCRTIRGVLFAAGSAFCSVSFAQASGSLSVVQNAEREVIAIANANVPRCGVTAIDDAPRFSLSGQTMSVVQPTAGVMCPDGVAPDTMRRYHVTLDFGRLPAGTYTINWDFPQLSAAYTISGDPGVQIGPGVTGSWFDPQQSGHGFDLQVLATTPPQLLATWFVFDPAGNATWITGVGPITGSQAVVQAAQVAGPGAVFPPNFNPAAVGSDYWGTLTFSFDACDSGQVRWHSVHAAYGDGVLPISRLTMPAGLSCP